LSTIQTSTDFCIGEEQAKRLLEVNGMELSMAELKEMAVSFLTKTNDQIEDVRKLLCQKYNLAPDTTSSQVQDFLNEKFQVKVEGEDFTPVLDYYLEEKKKVLEFIKKQDLFPIPENQDFMIIRTPSFLEPTIPAGAMSPPQAFRKGIRKSLVYLTLSRELLVEHTGLSIGSMIIHEGYGHHLQYSMGYDNPSIVRKFADFLDLAEGFATYNEGYFLEQEYMKEALIESKFVTLRDFCRFGARVLIDLCFMTGNKAYLDAGFFELTQGDLFENAELLLQKLCGFSLERCEAEVNWYSQAPGYPLSYLAGNFLTYKLKSDMAQKTGLRGLDLDRKFHKAFLEAGCMPMSYLRKVFQNQRLVD